MAKFVAFARAGGGFVHVNPEKVQAVFNAASGTTLLLHGEGAEVTVELPAKEVVRRLQESGDD
jgi:hypothetical protein